MYQLFYFIYRQNLEGEHGKKLARTERANDSNTGGLEVVPVGARTNGTLELTESAPVARGHGKEAVCIVYLHPHASLYRHSEHLARDELFQLVRQVYESSKNSAMSTGRREEGRIFQR